MIFLIFTRRTTRGMLWTLETMLAGSAKKTSRNINGEAQNRCIEHKADQ